MHCVFVKGHALYYGRAQLADDYFQKMGYHLPYRVNVADFILDLASGDVSMDDRQAPALHSTTNLTVVVWSQLPCALHASLLLCKILKASKCTATFGRACQLGERANCKSQFTVLPH